MDDFNQSETKSEPVTPQLAEQLARLMGGAIGVSSHGLSSLPAEHCARIRSAVDAEQCQLTVQIDLPSGNVRVLADGPGWLQPQCLFACEIPDPTSH